jgi:hypothetical protein
LLLSLAYVFICWRSIHTTNYHQPLVCHCCLLPHIRFMSHSTVADLFALPWPPGPFFRIPVDTVSHTTKYCCYHLFLLKWTECHCGISLGNFLVINCAIFSNQGWVIKSGVWRVDRCWLYTSPRLIFIISVMLNEAKCDSVAWLTLKLTFAIFSLLVCHPFFRIHFDLNRAVADVFWGCLPSQLLFWWCRSRFGMKCCVIINVLSACSEMQLWVTNCK